MPKQAYLQLRHGADELVRHLHVRAAGVVEGDKLRGQVLVAIEEPGVEMETPRRVGRRWEGEDLIPLSHLQLLTPLLQDAGFLRAISPGPGLQAYRPLYLFGVTAKVESGLCGVGSGGWGEEGWGGSNQPGTLYTDIQGPWPQTMGQ